MIADIVRNFTSRFGDGGWTTGNCYWFAVILKERFSGEIYYDTIAGHFCTKVGESFFDFHGEYHPEDLEATVKWSEFENYDSSQYKRVIRDCIL